MSYLHAESVKSTCYMEIQSSACNLLTGFFLPVAAYFPDLSLQDFRQRQRQSLQMLRAHLDQDLLLHSDSVLRLCAA